MTRDWLAWHRAYDDPGTPLGDRLRIVQELLERIFSTHETTKLRLLSLCAGDGRDVLPLVERWRGRIEISGRLIERDARLAELAAGFVERARIRGIDVVRGDAGRSASYAGAVPADLVLACGIFGNVSNLDVRRVVEAMPAICSEHGHVIWTRHRREPDLTPKIRRWFAAAGFAERAFRSPGPREFSVGWHELMRPPTPRPPLPELLFTFTR